MYTKTGRPTDRPTDRSDGRRSKAHTYNVVVAAGKEMVQPFNLLLLIRVESYSKDPPNRRSPFYCFIFLFFLSRLSMYSCSRSEFPLHSRAFSPPANGQRRGCLRDALAARPADGDWRCKGPHHHAYRVCGGGSHGDGDVVARRAVILAIILVRTFSFAAFSVC